MAHNRHSVMMMTCNAKSATCLQELITVAFRAPYLITTHITGSCVLVVVVLHNRKLQ